MITFAVEPDGLLDPLIGAAVLGVAYLVGVDLIDRLWRSQPTGAHRAGRGRPVFEPADDEPAAPTILPIDDDLRSTLLDACREQDNTGTPPSPAVSAASAALFRRVDTVDAA
jgi:hypothetical protein